MNAFTEIVKSLGPVAGTGVVFILLGVSLIIYRIKQINPIPISEDDIAKISDVYVAFDRDAFREISFEDAQNLEDLRAMFSAFNQTRITIQTTRESISNKKAKELLLLIIDDLNEIRKISPWDPHEINVKPDRDRMKADDDMGYVANWANNDGSGIVQPIMQFHGDNRPYWAIYRELIVRREPIKKTLEVIKRLSEKKLL